MASDVAIIFRGNSVSAVRASREVDASLTRLGATGGRVGGLLAGSMGRITQAAKVTSLAVGGGLTLGIAAAAKQAIGFDRSMRNVNSIAKLGERQLGDLEKQVLALAKTSGQAPKVLADGLYDIVSSGFEAEDALTVLTASAKAATAGLTDTATSAQGVTAYLNAYHLSAGQAKEVSDSLFQTVDDGVVSFEQLIGSLATGVLPTAAKANVSFKEVNAAIAELTKQGIPAAEATTSINNAITKILDPSEDLQKELKGIGFETGQAALQQLGFQGVLKAVDRDSKGNISTLQKWFPELRAFRGILGLTGKNLDDYNKLLDNQKKSSQGQGAAQRAYNEQIKSIGVQWDRAKAKFAAAAVPIGQLLFPALSNAAGKASDLAEWIGKLSEQPDITAKVKFAAQGGRDLAGGLVKQLQEAVVGKTIAIPIAGGQVKLQHADGLWQGIFGDQSFIQALSSATQKGIAAGGKGLTTLWRKVFDDKSVTQAITEAVDKGLGQLNAANAQKAAEKAKPFGKRFWEGAFDIVNTGTDPQFIASHIGDFLNLALLAVPVGRLAKFMNLKWLEILLKPLSATGEFLIRGGLRLAGDFVTGLASAFGRNAPAITRSLRSGIKDIPSVISGIARQGAQAAGQEVGEFASAGLRLAGRLLSGIDDGLGRLAARMAAKVVSGVKSVPGAVVTAVATAGAAIGSFFLNAIMGVVGDLASRAAAAVRSAVAAARDAASSGGGGLLDKVTSPFTKGLGGLGNPLKRAAGGDIRGPALVLAGENPRYPREWFITPDPAHRQKNLRYWADAGRALGVPGFASGGSVGPPLFRREGPDLYGAAYRHNRDFAVPGPYQTHLSGADEKRFRAWVSRYGVPFDPNARTVDYDMRGYWRSTSGAAFRGGHFPDTWKTPYDTTFSRESRYATKDNPFFWKGERLVDQRTGRVVFAAAASGLSIGPQNRNLGSLIGPALRGAPRAGNIGLLDAKSLPHLDSAITSNAKRLGRYARAAGADATRYASLVDQLTTTYQQQESTFSNNPLEYTTTDADGVEHVNTAAVSEGRRRVSVLSTLRTRIQGALRGEEGGVSRQRAAARARATRLRGLSRSQRAKLKRTSAAIAAKRRQKVQLRKRQNALRDTLRRHLTNRPKAPAAPTGKKISDSARAAYQTARAAYQTRLAGFNKRSAELREQIDGVTDDIRGVDGAISGLDSARQGQAETLRGLQGQLTDVARTLTELGDTAGDLPYEIRQAAIDLAALAKEGKDIADTAVDAPKPDEVDPTAVSPDIDLAAAQAGLTEDTADDVAALRARQAADEAILAGANGPLTTEQKTAVINDLVATKGQIASLTAPADTTAGAGGAGAGAGGDDAHDSAIAAQTGLRLQQAEAKAAALAAANGAFGSAGDIYGGGFGNAYQAAASGGLVHVSVLTGDPRTVRAIGAAATAGQGMQASVTTPRMATVG